MSISHLSRRAALVGGGWAMLGLPKAAGLSESALLDKTIIPTASDVCFSSRFGDPKALPIAKALGANRLDWTYSTNKDFLRQAKIFGLNVIGGTINMCPPDIPGSTRPTYLRGRQQNYRGDFIVAPWMSGEGRNWGCVNNPDFLLILLHMAQNALSAGCDYLQFDDPAGAVQSVSWGGCWCDFCRAAAKKYGLSLKNQMLDIQKRSLLDFISNFRQKLDEINGKRIIISCNNYNGDMGEPSTAFDFGICEIQEDNCSYISIKSLFNNYRKKEWMQVFTFRTGDVYLNRLLISAAHALGGSSIIPWDIYMGSGRPRFFGATEDFFDVYAQVRALGPLLSGAEEANYLPEDILTADGLNTLKRSGMETVIRSYGTLTIMHVLPSNRPTEGEIPLPFPKVPFKVNYLMSRGGRSSSHIQRMSLSSHTWSTVVMEKR
ncbi:hypothetical protein [Novosphingobium colocasiae]|uniref:hypothetical protein n=1 Tax=Novosphingobium colocasiae TaxID=1256513 RepID=UPI0016729FF1|nr:hypothetical protein [Novosphingobium colocasiae]